MTFFGQVGFGFRLHGIQNADTAAPAAGVGVWVPRYRRESEAKVRLRLRAKSKIAWGNLVRGASRRAVGSWGKRRWEGISLHPSLAREKQ